MENLSLRKMMHFVFEKIKDNLGLFAATMVVESVIIGVCGILAIFIAMPFLFLFRYNTWLLALTIFALFCALIYIISFVNCGINRVSLDVYDSGTSSFERFLEFTSNLVANYILVSFLYLIIVGTGLILLIIPGIFFATRLTLSGVILVDKKTTAVAALQESYRITRTHELKILGAICIVLLIGMVPAIGNLLMPIMGSLCNVYIYRTLSGEKEKIDG